MSKGVEITDDSHIRITEDSQLTIKDGSKIEVQGTEEHPFFIQKVQNIAPVAAHIKEVNHIDPLSVESLFVSQVRNIEPLKIEKFNVTNLPVVNLALRQLPSLDLHIRDLPAVSLGTHQVFDVPSNYLLRMRFLGFELFRVHLNGRTCITPVDRFRREQERADNRSFPTVAAAGNPAIPSLQREKSATYTASVGCHHQHGGEPQCHGLRVGQGAYHGSPHDSGLRVSTGGGHR